LEAHLIIAEGMAGIIRFFIVLHAHPRLSMNGMNHAFDFPAEAGRRFTDPGGMEG